MKAIAYDQATSVTTYEHNGVTFKCVPQFVVDVLMNQKINAMDFIEQSIDKLVAISKAEGKSTNFTIRCKVENEKITADEIKSSITVLVKERFEPVEEQKSGFVIE